MNNQTALCLNTLKTLLIMLGYVAQFEICQDGSITIYAESTLAGKLVKAALVMFGIQYTMAYEVVNNLTFYTSNYVMPEITELANLLGDNPEGDILVTQDTVWVYVQDDNSPIGGDWRKVAE